MTVVDRCRTRCEAEGYAGTIDITHADVCDSGLPDGSADFVWGEDAWCYVEDKAKLVAEAARLAQTEIGAVSSAWSVFQFAVRGKVPDPSVVG